MSFSLWICANRQCGDDDHRAVISNKCFAWQKSILLSMTMIIKIYPNFQNKMTLQLYVNTRRKSYVCQSNNPILAWSKRVGVIAVAKRAMSVLKFYRIGYF